MSFFANIKMSYFKKNRNVHKKCHIMKLRHIYFYFLLYISVSIEELLLSNKRNTKYGRGNIRRKVRKRQNFQINDEREPLAQIDVSNFIQNPDENSVDELYSDLFDERKQEIDELGTDDTETEQLQFDKIASQDYQNLEDFPERNIYKERHIVPQYMNVNEFSDDLNVKIKKHDTSEFSPPSFGKTAHKEKKCSYNNMKMPFFSHSKTETAKSKKNKKRKFSFVNFKKQNSSVTKLTESHLNNGVQIPTKEPQDFKIKKRSYFERLCPACKQKILNANLFENKPRGAESNVIHNSRQYYQNRNEETKNIFNRQDTPYTKNYNFNENDINSQNDIQKEIIY